MNDELRRSLAIVVLCITFVGSYVTDSDVWDGLHVLAVAWAGWEIVRREWDIWKRDRAERREA